MIPVAARYELGLMVGVVVLVVAGFFGYVIGSTTEDDE